LEGATVTPDQLEAILRETLEDRRLSRGEKRALRLVLGVVMSSEKDIALARSAAFAVARESLNDAGLRAVLDWLEDVVKLTDGQPKDQPARAECHFTPGDDCPTRIGGLFAAAKRSADVCVFTITDDRITAAILEAHRRGIAIRILTDNEKAFDPGSDINRMETAGVKVRVDKTPYHMHHKFAIIDEELLLNGSYNWTRGAAENNEENFIITDDKRLVVPFRELFERLWKQFG
jgi:phosphatidylserine/phosphatidylglycerophosphate/cardiolipin synthase-like enzyme